jgi:hypothetical protein
MRVNSGTDHQSRVSYDTASTGTGAYAALNYIALTTNSTAPAAGDTTLASEITTAGGGLIRKQATYSHSNGTNTALLSAVFTINASDVTPTTPAKSAIFNAASGGTMGYESAIPSPPTLVYTAPTGDSMTDNYTFTL